MKKTKKVQIDQLQMQLQLNQIQMQEDSFQNLQENQIRQERDNCQKYQVNLLKEQINQEGNHDSQNSNKNADNQQCQNNKKQEKIKKKIVKKSVIRWTQAEIKRLSIFVIYKKQILQTKLAGLKRRLFVEMANYINKNTGSNRTCRLCAKRYQGFMCQYKTIVSMINELGKKYNWDALDLFNQVQKLRRLNYIKPQQSSLDIKQSPEDSEQKVLEIQSLTVIDDEPHNPNQVQNIILLHNLQKTKNNQKNQQSDRIQKQFQIFPINLEKTPIKPYNSSQQIKRIEQKRQINEQNYQINEQLPFKNEQGFHSNEQLFKENMFQDQSNSNLANKYDRIFLVKVVIPIELQIQIHTVYCQQQEYQKISLENDLLKKSPFQISNLPLKISTQSCKINSSVQKKANKVSKIIKKQDITIKDSQISITIPDIKFNKKMLLQKIKCLRMVSQNQNHSNITNLEAISQKIQKKKIITKYLKKRQSIEKEKENNIQIQKILVHSKIFNYALFHI